MVSSQISWYDANIFGWNVTDNTEFKSIEQDHGGYSKK